MVVSMFLIILIGFHDFKDSFMEFGFFVDFYGFLVFLVGCTWLSISFYARMTMTNHWSINIYLVKIVTYDAREKSKNRLKKTSARSEQMFLRKLYLSKNSMRHKARR